MGISTIDMLLCTNYDEDHASGVPSLVDEGISVETIYGNPTVPPEVIEHLKSEDGMGAGIRVLVNTFKKRGAPSIAPANIPGVPGLTLRSCWNQWPNWDTENNLSLVCILDIYGFRFMFPGDIERNGLNNMLRNPEFADLVKGVDVLFAPHHGRENGKCEALFDDFGCAPTLVVISDCAKKYQSQETVPYYASKAKGVSGFRGHDKRKVLTTRRDGYLRFKFENLDSIFGATCNVD